jgi:hypothetical protein
MSLKDVLRATFNAQEHNQADKQRFDPRVCQCCGYFRNRDEDPECVCDGLNWHMDKDGRIECEAHRFERAIGRGRTIFGMRR